MEEMTVTEHKNIYAALVAAQKSFGQVKKGSINPAFRSKYADLADVAAVVIPALNANGVAVLHYIVDCGDDGPQAMRTEFIHANSETRVTCDVRLIVAKNDMQGMKSATTYAKRIGLESLSGIAPEDDDGNAAAKAPPPKQVQRDDEAAWFSDHLPNVKDADGINALLGRAKKAGRDVQMQVVARANELGLEFDADKRCYVYLEHTDAAHDAAVKAEANGDLGSDEIPYQ